MTVIMTTYNSPAWLEKVLWGFSVQTHPAFEIIIADDGSTPETAQCIERMRAETALELTHVWQEDRGFRKCRVLNKAILHAGSEYLVFTDGDCIPRRDFLETHARCAAPGFYLSGSYQKLPMDLSQALTREDILAGRCFNLGWLRANGLPRRRKDLKLAVTPLQGRLLNQITLTRCNLKGSNASAYLDDVLNVQGFDERMQWGGLDREFGIRLINSGVRPRHVRYTAVCVHLDHARGYRDPQAVAQNTALRKASKRRGVIRTEHGIGALLAGGYRPTRDSLAMERWRRRFGEAAGNEKSRDADSRSAATPDDRPAEGVLP